MTEAEHSRLGEILRTYERELLADWLTAQRKSGSQRPDLIGEQELRQQSTEFIKLLIRAMQNWRGQPLTGPAAEELRSLLGSLSRSRALQGFSPSETATFVFSFKEPLFARLRTELSDRPAEFAMELWAATQVLDHLGMYTAEAYQKSREEIIKRQQMELLELSTPVVKLWRGILALPLIGTLDSARTQVVLESLLQKIVETGSEIAIIDITGVPTVDTLVAQHLLKTVAAARLMGADCIISGIRPQIAQTIVHLGVTLTDVVTKASMADAFALALRRMGMTIEASAAPGTA
ncbi:MAG: STAS domain-containing protein [Nitrospiria bacterium]